jgi:hypothetical protein
VCVSALFLLYVRFSLLLLIIILPPLLSTLFHPLHRHIWLRIYTRARMQRLALAEIKRRKKKFSGFYDERRHIFFSNG